MNLILGSVQFGMPYGISNNAGQPSRDTVFKTLDTAWNCGVRILDSAQAYGQANSIIAAYHKLQEKRFSIINKIMRHPEDPANILSSLSREMDMLGIDKFHCIMIHHAESLPHDLPVSFFETLKTKFTDRLGLSIEIPDDYHKLKEQFYFDIIQLPLNIFSQNFISDNFLQELKKRHVEIHIRSAFLQGLAITNPALAPAYLGSLASKIQNFQKDCEQHGISPAAACFLYLLEKGLIDYIVSGAQNPTQLEEIFSSLKEAYTFQQQAKNLIWKNYACGDYDLVHPSCWPKLQEQYARKIT